MVAGSGVFAAAVPTTLLTSPMEAESAENPGGKSNTGILETQSVKEVDEDTSTTETIGRDHAVRGERELQRQGHAGGLSDRSGDSAHDAIQVGDP